MHILIRPIYNNLLKNNNNNNRRFFSLNISNNLDVIDNKLNIINNNIKGVYMLTFTNFFVSVVSLFC
jgi:hypothetical protein